MEVEMKIRGLMMDPVTNMPIVILKDVERQHACCRSGWACMKPTPSRSRSKRSRRRGR